MRPLVEQQWDVNLLQQFWGLIFINCKLSDRDTLLVWTEVSSGSTSNLDGCFHKHIKQQKSSLAVQTFLRSPEDKCEAVQRHENMKEYQEDEKILRQYEYCQNTHLWEIIFSRVVRWDGVWWTRAIKNWSITLTGLHLLLVYSYSTWSPFLK